MRSEFQLIGQIRKKIGRKSLGPLGASDDAEIVPASRGELIVAATDVIVDGVDFRIPKDRPEAIGRKALAVNLSDLAAAGAWPVGFVIALGVPKALGEGWLLRFYDGMIRLAKKYRVLCLGGDISASKEFFAAVTVLGRAKRGRLVTRRGARPGDWIGVTGTLGGSILGRHLTFEPRLREARFLAEKIRPSAMIDISDGLVQDLGHLLGKARLGYVTGYVTGAELDLGKIPVSSAARKRAKKNAEKALEGALSDGEDFELLFSVSPAGRRKLDRLWRRKFSAVKLSWIGRMTPRRGKIEFSRGGRPAAAPRLKKKGYEHFR